MAEIFDPSLYNRLPQMNLVGAVYLAHGLLGTDAAASPELSLARARERLQQAVAQAEQALVGRQGTPLEEKAQIQARPIDVKTDRAWGALRMRLEACAALPADIEPKAPRAAQILAALFGADGLAFLREPYHVQWVTMSAILKRIEQEQLAAEIEAIAGSLAYLEHVKRCQEEYGQMVQALANRTSNTASDVRAALSDLRLALQVYVARVVALYEPGEAESAALVEARLRPIARFRIDSARRGAASAEVYEPEPESTDLPAD